jgi:hypothetical protein
LISNPEIRDTLMNAAWQHMGFGEHFVRSDNDCSAFSQALRMMKSVMFRPSRSAAALMRASSEAARTELKAAVT